MDKTAQALAALIEICEQIERAGNARVQIAPDLRQALCAAIAKATAA